MPRIGIDLGGTKIEGIVLERDGRISIRERATTPAGDYPATLAVIVALVQRLEQQRGQQCSIGVGTPGALSPHSGLLRNANSTCLNGQALDRDLAERLGRPVRIANDADCFALSEASDGAASDAASVFGVIVGTGTGGGIVVHGRLLDGPNRIAGEWGHNPLPWPADDERPGPACYCGRNGCIETFLSGPGLAFDYRPGAPKLSAKQIAQRAADGEAAAEACLARYEDRMARGLASVINILDPEVIVLGGGLSNIQRLYRNVPRLWPRYIFSDVVRTRLVPPAHGDSSGVRGAAWLWPTA
ncbi:MAG: ROK family protein [Chromatiaceae bacterium]|nr:ROK family protein [Chromatiaceae bacterium]